MPEISPNTAPKKKAPSSSTKHHTHQNRSHQGKKPAGKNFPLATKPKTTYKWKVVMCTPYESKLCTSSEKAAKRRRKRWLQNRTCVRTMDDRRKWKSQKMTRLESWRWKNLKEKKKNEGWKWDCQIETEERLDRRP
ncbi:hypothetical protein ACFX16_045425 [Malus domestica]